MRRTILAIMAASSVALFGAALLVDEDRSEQPPDATTTTSSVLTTTCTGATTSSTTTTSERAPTTITAPTTTLPPALRVGAVGDAVLALEVRLDELGYFVGAVDGTFDEDTHHGVVAFQKLSGLARDGAVGPATQVALEGATRPAPRTLEDRGLEVDLAHQVILVVDAGKVTKVLDTSTGKTPGLTPTGHHTIYRQIDGWRHAPLGTLYRPKYFYLGLAIHGYSSVPPWPASHGCVRVTNSEMDWLWSSGTAEVGQRVVIY